MASSHGKKYREAASKVDASRAYGPDEAISLLKEVSYTKFDATVEAHLRLGIDVRHADQQVRSTVVLPAGTGKAVRVVVFAQGDKATEALAAGAERVGGDDLATLGGAFDVHGRRCRHVLERFASGDDTGRAGRGCEVVVLDHDLCLLVG